MIENAAPPQLRDRIAADLAPVAPLAKPWVRAAATLLPLAVLLLFAAPTIYSLRGDAGPARDGRSRGACRSSSSPSACC